jgi:hypothetical protein
MEATLWPRGLGVISNDSALDLSDLCDVNPANVRTVLITGGGLHGETRADAVHLAEIYDPATNTEAGPHTRPCTRSGAGS